MTCEGGWFTVSTAWNFFFFVASPVPVSTLKVRQRGQSQTGWGEQLPSLAWTD